MQRRTGFADDCGNRSQNEASEAASFSRHRTEPVQGFRDVGHAFLRDAKYLLAHPQLKRTIVAYTIASLCLLAAALWCTSLKTVVTLVAIGWLLFPLTEYVVHRYVLHPLIYLDNRISARFWIRVHYAHHDHPSRFDVILASPVSVLMLIGVLNIPVALIAGPGAILAGALAIIVPFMFYEFVHFSAHTQTACESPYLVNRQRLHLLHHFHNENRNYGICCSAVDKLVGTHAPDFRDVERSATARNLGYDETLARKKPMVRIEYERRYLGR